MRKDLIGERRNTNLNTYEGDTAGLFGEMGTIYEIKII